MSTEFLTNGTPNFIQNTDILTTLKSSEIKGVEGTIAYNNIESFFISTLVEYRFKKAG